MPTTETRTYIGQTGTQAFDGYCGFVVGRQYQLQVERDGERVRIELPHVHCAPGQQMEVTVAQFERWFVK